MKLLIDTNIFLEVILAQSKIDEAKDLLSKTDEHEFFITDYSLHSIGLLLFQRGRHEVFRKFLADLILIAGTKIIALKPVELEGVVDTAKRYNLDFDDAYQYVAAEYYELTIVSFDEDFDRTKRGRRTPISIKS